MPSTKLDATQWVALLKTAVFFALLPGTVAGLIPYQILRGPEIPLFAAFNFMQWLGFVLFLLAACGLLVCGWQFATLGRGTPAPIDPPKELVVTGPYRWVRNPMYVCVVAALLSETLFFQSTALLSYTAFIWLIFQLFVTLYEEPALRAQFGQSYEQYCRQVWRWIPRPPR